MNRFQLLIILFSIPILSGCAAGEFKETTPDKQQIVNGYCHRIIEPIGPTDLIRPTQSRAGDYINYSGPCDGLTAAEQLRKQRRFERFHFGRDFMPG